MEELRAKLLSYLNSLPPEWIDSSTAALSIQDQGILVKLIRFGNQGFATVHLEETEHHKLILILEGTLTTHVGQDSLQFTPGTLIIAPAGMGLDIVARLAATTASHQSLVIEFPKALLERMLKCHPELGISKRGCLSDHQRVSIQDLEVPLTAHLVEALCRMLDTLMHYSQRTRHLLDHQAIEIILALAAGQKPHQIFYMLINRENNLLDQIRYRIQLNPGAHWTANELANELAVSESTLRRRLKRTGTNLLNILHDVRMHHATVLLQNSNLSITEIAAACGYDSPARFSARFRAFYAKSPSDYKKVERTGQLDVGAPAKAEV